MYSRTPAETIIHGGRIATLDRARPFVSALAIARGRVLVPSLADALRMLRRQAERVRGYPHCRICHPLPPANPQDARRGVRPARTGPAPPLTIAPRPLAPNLPAAASRVAGASHPAV